MTKLSALIRLLLLFAMAVFILLFFYFGVFVPKDERVKSLLSEVESLEKKASGLRQQKKEIQSSAPRLTTSPDIPKDILASAPQIDDTPELLSKWTKQGKSLRLEFLLFKPAEEKPLGPLIEMPIAIKLRGTFDQTLQFLRYLSTGERKILISDIDMSRPEKREGNYVISTQAVVTAFRKQGK